MQRSLGLCLVLCGCSFSIDAGSLTPSDAGTEPLVDGSGADSIDAANATPIIRTFGERPNLDHSGVTTDTYVDQMFPSVLHGDWVDMLLDGGPVSTGLIRFDVSVLSSPTASVISAELRVVTAGVENSPGFLVREATQAWSNSSQWPGPTVGASLGGPSNIDADTEYVISLPAAIVQRWITMPGTNQGVALTKTGGEDVFVHTRESATASARPSLAITLLP